MKLLLSAFAAILLGGLTASSSHGAMAYGVTLIGNQLISVDTNTGNGTTVGSLTGNVAPYGLATVGNQLFTFDSTADVIRQISMTTGATVSTYNIGIGPVIGQGGLAFQSSTVGYLTTALDPATFNQANNLYQFNLSTGQTTLIAQTADTLESIAFAANGTLYGLGQLDGNLYTVSTTTGATTLVGNLGLSIGSPVGAIAFLNGSLYATVDDALYSVSTSTGAATAIGNPAIGTGFASISGLAFAPNAVVPEPGSVILLASGIIVSAGVARLRKRSAA